MYTCLRTQKPDLLCQQSTLGSICESNRLLSVRGKVFFANPESWVCSHFDNNFWSPTLPFSLTLCCGLGLKIVDIENICEDLCLCCLSNTNVGRSLVSLLLRSSCAEVAIPRSTRDLAVVHRGPPGRIYI